MKTYGIELTGITPLLMHADSIPWADEMERWKLDPANRKSSKAGDDRTPAFRWLGSLYHDGSHVCMPSDNLMRCLMEGGAMVPAPGGRGGKTLKAQTQSGCQPVGMHLEFLVNGKQIPIAPLLALREVRDFADHEQAVKDLGFALHVKRAKIGMSKHIRVRPEFHGWSVRGSLRVTDEQITKPILEQILTCSGEYKGLCDWRPGSRTPGPYGMFTAKVS